MPSERRSPNRLVSPTSVVAAQMDALQINDWPDSDAGIDTAFIFAMPQDAGGTMVTHRSARSWAAKEEWLDRPGFRRMLHDAPYAAMINCTSWKAVSGLQFPSQRYPNKAVLAVEVEHAGAAAGAATAAGGPALPAAAAGKSRLSRFTFCLEMVETGAYKECWLTVGVRVGDYTTST